MPITLNFWKRNTRDFVRETHTCHTCIFKNGPRLSAGLNDNMMTVALFIDMEEAFDTVWREGLLVKLFRMGIKGTMWNWLKDFVTCREAVCCIGK
ncbi:hypothetical protein DPMN_106908 [Dreissena polymorpha]|uniref:Reverse transcriptase domain-containing protein n=1 Tax=Dreissena polymorpha TaxID=45954 RepID=A0A9D4QJC9_DREPO|nr:hypothetical protein DPMN_106908 [Dreissena polymorpha]